MRFHLNIIIILSVCAVNGSSLGLFPRPVGENKLRSSADSCSCHRGQRETSADGGRKYFKEDVSGIESDSGSRALLVAGS